jgi:hypothetical protein
MPISPSLLSRSGKELGLDLARVLLVHGELASRLTLQTILRAGGYSVDVASTPEEAFCRLDENQYELVLSDARSDVGSVLSYARAKDYRPATALLTSYKPPKIRPRSRVSIYTENLPTLFTGIAELIGARVTRRHRLVRHAV